MVASWLGVAVLIGARAPLARVFESHNAAAASVLSLALAAFAPGLIGYGLSANLSRVLYARRRNRAPALAIGGGWLLVIVADLLIVPFVRPDRVVPALGLGSTIGLTVSGIALLVLVRRERGADALRGVSRAFLAGLAGSAAAAVAGTALASVLPVTGFLLNIAMSVLVTAVITGVFTAIVLRLDGGDLRSALSRLRSRSTASEPDLSSRHTT
jgi:putative peptidoglycan lipid II flippase